MITVTSAFKQAIADGSRKYLCYADITLASGRVLNLTNIELWENGFSKEDAVSDDNRFTALGATIIGSASISIKNQNEEYSSYDFTNAKVVLWVGLAGIASSKIRLGTYTVDEMHYTEASITLTMLDNMEQFDRSYSNSSLSYPATLSAIVGNACTCCGVTLATSSFPHYNFSIPERPADEGLTFREVIGMAAAIAGCFCRCRPDGKLELKWFDRTTLDNWRTAYSRGSVTPASSYSGMHYLSYLFSQDISVDDVCVTGVRLTVEKASEANGRTEAFTYTAGTAGYVIGMQNNDLLNACTEEQIIQVRDWLSAQLVGLTFRKASISHVSDPSIEAGDVGAVWDRRNRGYPILVTRTNFSPGNQQQTVSGAETPSRNAATRYGWQTKAYVESKKQLNAEQTLREQLIQDLQEAIASSPGLYKTEVQRTGGGSDIYYHNLPTLNESDIRILISSAGITVTANGTARNPTWYGLTVDGNMISNILSAIGVDADWINTGTIRSRDGSVQINLDNNTINLKGVTSFAGFVTDTDLSTAGRTTINGANITTGKIQDANSNTVLNLSTGALTIKKGSININDGTFKVTTQGALTATSATIEGTIKAGNSSGYWVKLAATGEMQGGYGNTKYGYIDFSGDCVDIDTGEVYNGIQIQGGCLRISTRIITVARSTSINTTTTHGGNGTLGYISRIQDNGDGTITWWNNTIQFINGIMVSQL